MGNFQGGEIVVRNGLARIDGTRTVTYDTKTSKVFLDAVQQIESKAKESNAGGWKR